MHMPPEQLLHFPCDFIFKAFGPNAEPGQFAREVQEAIANVVPVPLDALKIRLSSRGTYVCVSVLVRLHSFDQMQEVYQALRGVEGLKFLL